MKEVNVTEVRSDFFDENEKCWCVDAWIDDNDDGVVAAKIYPATLEVKYFHNLQNNKLIHEVVRDVLKQIIDEELK